MGPVANRREWKRKQTYRKTIWRFGDIGGRGGGGYSRRGIEECVGKEDAYKYIYVYIYIYIYIYYIYIYIC
jgi:myosin-crossreactive antigen